MLPNIEYYFYFFINDQTPFYFFPLILSQNIFSSLTKAVIKKNKTKQKKKKKKKKKNETKQTHKNSNPRSPTTGPESQMFDPLVVNKEKKRLERERKKNSKQTRINPKAAWLFHMSKTYRKA